MDQVDIAWYDEGEHLLAGPEWLGLQDGRLRYLSIPTRKPHQQVHDICLGKINNVAILNFIHVIIIYI